MARERLTSQPANNTSRTLTFTDIPADGAIIADPSGGLVFLFQRTDANTHQVTFVTQDLGGYTLNDTPSFSIGDDSIYEVGLFDPLYYADENNDLSIDVDGTGVSAAVVRVR